MVFSHVGVHFHILPFSYIFFRPSFGWRSLAAVQHPTLQFHLSNFIQPMAYLHPHPSHLPFLSLSSSLVLTPPSPIPLSVTRSISYLNPHLSQRPFLSVTQSPVLTPTPPIPLPVTRSFSCFNPNPAHRPHRPLFGRRRRRRCPRTWRRWIGRLWWPLPAAAPCSWKSPWS